MITKVSNKYAFTMADSIAPVANYRRQNPALVETRELTKGPENEPYGESDALSENRLKTNNRGKGKSEPIYC